MKTNYRIQSACPNCKFSLRGMEDIFYCNKDEKYNSEWDIFNDSNADLIWDWENSHTVGWCGICGDYDKI